MHLPIGNQQLSNVAMDVHIHSLTKENFNLEQIEKRVILEALKFFNGNKSRTATALGVTLKTLYNKLHCYGYFDKKED